jgi:hypothetical protein
LNFQKNLKIKSNKERLQAMLLNLIVAVIVGFIILILWVLKGVYDCISTMDQLIKKLSKVTDLLHDRLSRVERLMNDRVEAKKNTTKDE